MFEIIILDNDNGSGPNNNESGSNNTRSNYIGFPTFLLFFYLSPNVFIRACKITASSLLSFCEKQQRLSFIVKDSEKVLETLRAPFTF